MSHMARNVTVWEFINMKVNRSLQRPNAKIRIADMLNELEELLRHYRQLASDELRPVPCDTDQPYPASKILVVSLCLPHRRYLLMWPRLPDFYARQHICYSAYMPRQIRPSVTRVYCIKMAEHIVKILSPSDRPVVLVFRHQWSLRKSDGFIRNMWHQHWWKVAQESRNFCFSFVEQSGCQ